MEIPAVNIEVWEECLKPKFKDYLVQSWLLLCCGWSFFKKKSQVIQQCSGLSWKSCRSWSEFLEIQTLICKEMCKKILVLTKNCRSRTDGPALVSNTFNSSPPSAAYMRQWIETGLVEIMAWRWTQLNFNEDTKLFIHENASEKIICKMVAILSRGRWFKPSWILWSLSLLLSEQSAEP